MREPLPAGGAGMGGGGGGGNGNGNGNGVVDIPDAIPAELNYDVRYQGEEGDGGRAAVAAKDALAVELVKSQDLRVRGMKRSWCTGGGGGARG